LLLSGVTDPQHAEVWTGAVNAAGERSANLVCVDCGLGPDTVSVCDVITSETFDGLILYLCDSEGKPTEIMQRTKGLPVVNLAQLHEGYPGIVSGHYEGMRRLLQHLVEVHGYERIAFVQEVARGRAADARYRAYVEVMTAYELPCSADLLVERQRTSVGGSDGVWQSAGRPHREFTADDSGSAVAKNGSEGAGACVGATGW
jgi:DNA-binding LacI/PurR family transcriptional regulator